MSEDVPTTTSSPEHITQFEEIEWGALEADVLKRYGDPLAREMVVNGVELAYQRTVNGRKVEAEFTIHKDHGLIVGCYVVPFSSPDECQASFASWRGAIIDRYADLKPREEKEVEADGVSFADAFGRGQASWCVEWDDPTGLARIELLVWPASEAFWVSYYGPHADDWEEERFEAEHKPETPNK